jgi:hypothetical protein
MIHAPPPQPTQRWETASHDPYACARHCTRSHTARGGTPREACREKGVQRELPTHHGNTRSATVKPNHCRQGCAGGWGGRGEGGEAFLKHGWGLAGRLNTRIAHRHDGGHGGKRRREVPGSDPGTSSRLRGRGAHSAVCGVGGDRGGVGTRAHMWDEHVGSGCARRGAARESGSAASGATRCASEEAAPYRRRS